MAIDWRDLSHPARLEYEAKAAPFKVPMPQKPSIEDNDGWLKYIQEREIKRLQCWIEHGLHPVYDTFDDALHDYFPDFRWNDAGFKEDVRTILGNQEWQILAGRLLEVRGWNILEQMQLALDHVDE